MYLCIKAIETENQRNYITTQTRLNRSD